MTRIVAVLSFVIALGGASAALADAIPSDSCKPWEHWEGAHDGGCKFGCARTSAAAPKDPNAALWGGIAAGAGALLILRTRRRG